MKFVATQSKGKVSALWQSPDGSAAVLVLAHGAGANMQHAHMQNIADALGQRSIATLRFNFPYMEAGGGRTDKPEVCIETIGNAISLAREHAGDLPLFVGGHSFGGRMSSHYAAERRGDIGDDIEGLVYFSFPLHPAKKPDTKRAAHLTDIELPQLFLSGTRDALADLELLTSIVTELPGATLHELDTADHSFRILKRTRQSEESVYDEAARIAADWMAGLRAR